MCCLKLEQIIDSFTHDILKIATPSTSIKGMDSKLINSYIKISINFTNEQLFYFFWKNNKNGLSVRKTRTFQLMVVNTMHFLIFYYSRKDIDWSINCIKWNTVFSYGLSSSAIRK